MSEEETYERKFAELLPNLSNEVIREKTKHFRSILNRFVMAIVMKRDFDSGFSYAYEIMAEFEPVTMEPSSFPKFYFFLGMCQHPYISQLISMIGGMNLRYRDANSPEIYHAICKVIEGASTVRNSNLIRILEDLNPLYGYPNIAGSDYEIEAISQNTDLKVQCLKNSLRISIVNGYGDLFEFLYNIISANGTRREVNKILDLTDLLMTATVHGSVDIISKLLTNYGPDSFDFTKQSEDGIPLFMIGLNSNIRMVRNFYQDVLEDYNVYDMLVDYYGNSEDASSFITRTRILRAEGVDGEWMDVSYP